MDAIKFQVTRVSGGGTSGVWDVVAMVMEHQGVQHGALHLQFTLAESPLREGQIIEVAPR